MTDEDKVEIKSPEEFTQAQGEVYGLLGKERTQEEEDQLDRLAVAILVYEHETVPELPDSEEDWPGMGELINRRESVGEEEERGTRGT